MNYLSLRARTASQVAEYLEKKGYDEHITAQVMERLTENHLVDDAAYARRFIELHKDHDGRLLLRQKLRHLGIAENVIESEITDLTFEEQVTSARELLDKKMRHDDREDALRRAMQSVLRRGYPYDVVRAAADRYKKDEFAEWEDGSC